MSSQDIFTLTVTGDVIQTRPILPYEGTDCDFDRLLQTLRQSDATVGNLEVLVHDFEGYPAATSGGTYMRSPPTVLDDLESVGFDLFSAATNHTFDYSHGGVKATIRNLERRQIPYAGIGSTLYEARKPGYVETGAGRVGVVSACTSFPPGSEAGEQSPALQGRPGLNPIHVSKVYNVSEDELDRLKTISETAGIEALKKDWFDRGLLYGHDWTNEDFFHFGDMKFSTTDGEPGITFHVDNDDLVAWERSIREATRNADWVVASVHSHQGVNGLGKTSETPEFLADIAHRSVDAGADAVVSHGPHVLRGVEIYNERPIFYSLGNFVVQNETVSRLPPESFSRYDLTNSRYVSDVFEERLFNESGEPKGDLADDRFWQTVVPVCEFSSDSLEVRLYPCTLQGEKNRPQRGIPQLATGDKATKILEQISNLSTRFETDIEIERDYGLIRSDL